MIVVDEIIVRYLESLRALADQCGLHQLLRFMGGISLVHEDDREGDWHGVDKQCFRDGEQVLGELVRLIGEAAVDPDMWVPVDGLLLLSLKRFAGQLLERQASLQVEEV